MTYGYLNYFTNQWRLVPPLRVLCAKDNVHFDHEKHKM